LPKTVWVTLEIWMQTKAISMLNLVFCNYYRNRDIAGVGQAESQSPDPEPPRDLRRPSAQMELRTLSWLAPHLKFTPADPPADPCSQRLGSGLLGCKTCRVALCGIFLALAVGNLAGRKNALKKCIAKALNAALDTSDLYEIGA
jgi:hypothetical protein